MVITRGYKKARNLALDICDKDDVDAVSKYIGGDLSLRSVRIWHINNKFVICESEPRKTAIYFIKGGQ
jgi:hypothetical protein